MKKFVLFYYQNNMFQKFQLIEMKSLQDLKNKTNTKK